MIRETFAELIEYLVVHTAAIASDMCVLHGK